MSETETCPVTKLDTVVVLCLQALFYGVHRARRDGSSFTCYRTAVKTLHHTHGHSVIKTTTESFQRQHGSDDHSALSDRVAEMESVLRGFVKE